MGKISLPGFDLWLVVFIDYSTFGKYVAFILEKAIFIVKILILSDAVYFLIIIMPLGMLHSERVNHSHASTI